MLEIIIASAIGIISGIISGLAPGIPMLLGYFIFLPLVPAEPLPLLSYAIISMMGSQFFGSQAALYYKIPGEASSFPVLFELKNFTSPKNIYKAVQTTTYGSLVASIFALVIMFVVLTSGLLTGLHLPILAKATIFAFLIVVTIYTEKRMLVNTIVLLLCAMLSVYEDIASVVHTLPMYYFNSLLALIIIFSTQLVFRINKDVGFDDTKVISTKFDWKRWYKPFSFYSFVGSLFGFIPQLGATLASYATYGWTKYKKQDPIQRVTASETANNSAILIAWIPLIIFGVPINAVEMLFMQYFTMLGFEFDFLNEFSNQVTLIITLLVSAVVFSVLALTTNKLMYRWIAVALNSRLFGIIIGAISVLMFWKANNYTGDFILTHLVTFLPISYLIAKYKVSMIPVVIGFLLTDPIVTTVYQVLEIYIL